MGHTLSPSRIPLTELTGIPLDTAKRESSTRRRVRLRNPNTP